MKVLGIHPNLRALGGNTRLFLTIMDWLKENDYQIEIWDRPNKPTAQTITVGTKTFQSMTVKQELVKRGAIERLESLKLFFPIKNIARSDIHLGEIPVVLVSQIYPRFSTVIEDRILDSDLVFFDSEHFAPLPLFHPNEKIRKKLAESGIYYTHFPLNTVICGNWHKILANSNFTKDAIRTMWKKEATVFYPPIDSSYYRYDREIKKREFDFIIYSRLHEDKVAPVNELLSRFKDRKIAVVGAKSDYEFKDIEPVYNVTFNKIIDYLSNSKIYIHFKGMGRRTFGESEPEHFGYSVVDALGCGCVALVPNKGGSVEIPNVIKYSSFDELWKMISHILNNQSEYEKNREVRANGIKVFDKSNRNEELKEIFKK